MLLTFNRSICRAALQSQEPAVVICDLKTDPRNVMKFLWHCGPSFKSLKCRAQGTHPSASPSIPALGAPQAEPPCSHIPFTICQCHHSRLAGSAHTVFPRLCFPLSGSLSLAFPQSWALQSLDSAPRHLLLPVRLLFLQSWNCRAVCQGCGVSIKLPAAHFCPPR